MIIASTVFLFAAFTAAMGTLIYMEVLATLEDRQN